jgi:hypothetical protein
MTDVEITHGPPEETIDQLEIGRQLLGQLFRALGVGRSIVVDDDYEFGVSEDRLLELLFELYRKHGEGPLDIVGINNIDSEEPISSIRQHIQNWSEDERLEQLRLLGEQFKDDCPTGPLFSDTLASLTQGICELVQLSPRRWVKERARYIAEAETGERREENRTLFLFDLDLGGKEPRGFNGRQLLEELRREIPRRSVLCGILSGMYRTEEEAQEAAAGGIVNPPVYLSKDRLDQEPESFAFGVRRTAMVEIVENVISTAIGVLRGAHGQAESDLRKLNVNDFERVVLQISQQEGVWEADTVFRIYNIYHRKAARSHAKQDGKLDRALEKMRTVGGIGADAPDGAEPLELKRIQALELYELADDLNHHFLPIELGDIFVVGDGEGAPLYVLLGQPCDLSLRPTSDDDGQLLGERKLTAPWLAKLVQYGKGGPSRNALAGNYQLPYILPDFGSLWVEFRSAKPVSLDILDLCAFERNGVATINVINEPPQELLPAWAGRYAELQSLYAGEIARRRDSDKFLAATARQTEVPASIREHLLRMPGAPFNIVGHPTIEGSSVTFSCRRVRRLVQPHAGVLLIKFANYISREAFDVDLARKVSK